MRHRIALFCLLGLLGAGALMHERDEPATGHHAVVPPAPRLVTATQPVRLGWRCAPAPAIGRTGQGLLAVCGPDRHGRNRWRPMSPATLRSLTY